MHLDELLKNLKLDVAESKIFGRYWLCSMATLPQGTPEFLEPEYLRQAFPKTELKPELLPELETFAARLAADPVWRRLAWHAHQTLTVYPEFMFNDWPDFDTQLDGRGGMFYLLIAISIVKPIQEKCRTHQLPEELVHCCSRIRGYFDTYGAGYGKPGLNRKQLYWLRYYLNLECFRIGRFEYMLSSAERYNITAFRQKSTGKILAMPGPATCWFDDSGYALYHDEDRKLAAFAGASLQNQAAVTGIPIDPAGHAGNRQVTLNLTEWEPVLVPCDEVVGLHIPEGGQMTLDRCGDSFRKAVEFFRQYFPEKNIRAICCISWIFYPYYEQTMPDSNLAKFMRELYLFPVASSGKDGVYFIFGRDDGDYRDYPRDNSVRRAMLDVLQNGGRLRVGGMFFLPEHLELFGAQPYRCQLKADL